MAFAPDEDILRNWFRLQVTEADIQEFSGCSKPYPSPFCCLFYRFFVIAFSCIDDVDVDQSTYRACEIWFSPQQCCWKFKSSGMWCCIIWWALLAQWQSITFHWTLNLLWSACSSDMAVPGNAVCCMLHESCIILGAVWLFTFPVHKISVLWSCCNGRIDLYHKLG